MARVIKEHSVRRNEILDVTRKLVYTKGYEQMTIQDILDDLQIAKGTFYHYFKSKQDLLEALLERMQEEGEHLLLPILHNDTLSALEKFQRFFSTLARWKTEQKTFLLSLMRVWYRDENAIVRHKLHRAGVKWITPLFTVIIEQGLREGVFTTAYAEQISEVIVQLGEGLNYSLAELLLSFEPERPNLARLEAVLAAYSDAIERVLGAPTGSLHIIDMETIKEWIVALHE